MFQKDDVVEAKNKRINPYWMTVIERSPAGWLRCRFGERGGDAGLWKDKELNKYEGAR